MSTTTIEGIEVQIAENNEYPRVLWQGNNNTIIPLAANEVNGVNNNNLGIYVKQSGKYYFVPKYVAPIYYPEIPEEQEQTNIIGIVLSSSASQSQPTEWTLIDENFYETWFNPNHRTYKNIKNVLYHGWGEFIEIPISYVKTEVLQEGYYAGKTCYWLADGPVDGFHVHPAFIGKDGQPHNLKIASWITSLGENNEMTSVDRGEDGYLTWKKYSDVHNYGWMSGVGNLYFRPYNIYDYHFLVRMIMIEFSEYMTAYNSNTSLINNLERLENSNRITYHGINDLFGTSKTTTWLDGLTTRNNTYQILSPDGSRTMIETGISCPNSDVYPTECYINTVNGINFGDIFIGSASDINYCNFNECIQKLYSNSAFIPNINNIFSLNNFLFSQEYGAPMNEYGFRLVGCSDDEEYL